MPRGPRLNFNINLNEGDQPPTQSSIDRFFWSKGVKFIGYSGSQWQLAAGIAGGAQLLAAFVFLILSLTVHGFPAIFPLIFGISGLSTVAGIFAYLKLNKKTLQPEVRMSGNGRKLLYRIGQHIGWHDHDAVRGHNHNPWGTWWQSVFGIKTASNVLTPQSAEIFEAGCSEYNRLTGLLKLAKDSNGRSTNMTPQIQAASDEAMISLINQVALLEDSPESHGTIVIHCKSQISKLKELADRYEELLSGPTTIADRLSSTTVMDNVLDQLRLEAQAHEELRIMDHQDN